MRCGHIGSKEATSGDEPPADGSAKRLYICITWAFTSNETECLPLPQASIWLLRGAALAGTPPKRMVNVRIQKLLALK
jgi:hypothetical protein